MSLFWVHQDFALEGYGYGQFSFNHILLLLISLIFVAFIIIKYKKSDEISRKKIRKAIAYSLIFFRKSMIKIFGYIQIKKAVKPLLIRF